MLAPRDLIDPDTEQAIEPARIKLGCHDAFTGPPDSAPRDPAQSGDRRLVHLRGQPRDQVIEVACEMRARASERDGFDHDAVFRTGQAAQRRSQLDSPHPEIEMPPPRRHRPSVIARRRLEATMRADQPPSTQRHGDYDQRGQELDAGDVDVIEAQQALECSSDAHGQVTSRFDGVEHLESWSRSVRVTRTLPNTPSPSNDTGPSDHPTHIGVRRAPNRSLTVQPPARTVRA